jgi:hypothetical protein
MTTNPIPLSKRVNKLLVARREELQWEKFILLMLHKLELPEEDRAKAIARYDELARHVARKLHVDQTDVHIVVQGSMRTQTTIAMWGNTKFDLDIVVKLSSEKYRVLRESEDFFRDFGESLDGIDGAGDPIALKRCWRLQYPGESFYFDVTPAIPTDERWLGTHLRVRDPVKTWNPSNPEEFANWFCDIANLRFEFQNLLFKSAMVLDEARVDPVPTASIGIDDILRRTVQLLKLHRDNFYRAVPERRDGAPISVILVTLAATAYMDMAKSESHSFTSAIEVALELATRLPRYIQSSNGVHKVMNPAIYLGPGENFAERWNADGGVRANEFRAWHRQLLIDLEALFSDEYSKRDEAKIRKVFGEPGVRAWRNSLMTTGVLAGLARTVPAEPRSNPKTPIPQGSRDQLA